MNWSKIAWKMVAVHLKKLNLNEIHTKVNLMDLFKKAYIWAHTSFTRFHIFILSRYKTLNNFRYIQLISFKGYRFGDKIPKWCITSGMIILMWKHKQSLWANFTLINSYIFCLPKLSSEWPFDRGGILCHIILWRCEFWS